MMKINKIVAISLLTFVSFAFSCKEKQKESEIESIAVSEQMQNDKISLISAEALDELLQSNSDIQVLDVRTAEEVAEGKISGSVNISVYEEEFAEMVKVLDTTKPVYIYCKMGGRSAEAAKIVENMFPKIYDLDGGITSWEEKELSIEKED